MRNLWLFISKYNAFFLFVIFFVFSVILMVRNNSYQRSVALSSSAKVIGIAYENINQFKSYLNLGAENDSLAAENARLKEQLKSAFYVDSAEEKTVKDTTLKQQYSYIVARVVNNSIHQKDNYITINRGKLHGITKGMGVISPSGVVGIVRNVSDHYSTIQSILHTDTRISASLAENNAFGSLVWGEDDFDPQLATLKDIPNHVIVKKGQRVITSGFSLFPAGIPVGRVIKTGIKGGESFLDIKVKLAADFSTLQYVYIVKNHLALEQQQLEENSKKDE
jgi:rod shape-determining protein MreC